MSFTGLGRTLAQDRSLGYRLGEANTAQIKITIETDRILMIRSRGCTRLWCQECGGEVDVVDLRQAEILTSVARPKPRAGAEANQWHYFESPDGTQLVCLQSLLKSM